MRTSSKLFGAAAVAGLVLVGGSALTDGNTVPDNVAGYGTSAVSGATATEVVHTLSADGKNIVSSKVTFNATQTGRTVKAGFGTTALEACVVDTAGTPAGMSATCTYAGAGYDTATATAFNVAVS